MSVEITGPGGTTSLFGNTVEVSRGAFVVEITSPGPQGPVGPMGVGDMAKSVYDPDDDGKVVSAVSADAAPWSGITGKPAAFPPETHTHTGVYSPVGHDHAGVYATASHNHDAVYSAIGHDHSGVYATASHSHAIADVTNLQTALNGKADTTHDHDSAYAALNHNHDAAYSPVGHDHSGTYATTGHTHTGVYAAATHSHAISDVTGLQGALDGKASTTHDHTGVYAPADHNHSGTYAPATHAHGNITSAGAIGSTSGLPVITTTSGALTTGSFGSTSGTFAEGDHTHTLDGLSDVTITTPSSGQVLSYDGSGWVNATAGGGSGDVVGPSSAQADGIPVFDGTTGKLLKDSLYRCTDFIRKNVGSGKGYLVGFSGSSSVSGIAPGTDGQVLMADSAQTLGVKWATPSASGGANLWQLLL